MFGPLIFRFTRSGSPTRRSSMNWTRVRRALTSSMISTSTLSTQKSRVCSSISFRSLDIKDLPIYNIWFHHLSPVCCICYTWLFFYIDITIFYCTLLLLLFFVLLSICKFLVITLWVPLFRSKTNYFFLIRDRYLTLSLEVQHPFVLSCRVLLDSSLQRRRRNE